MCSLGPSHDFNGFLKSIEQELSSNGKSNITLLHLEDLRRMKNDMIRSKISPNDQDHSSIPET